MKRNRPSKSKNKNQLILFPTGSEVSSSGNSLPSIPKNNPVKVTLNKISFIKRTSSFLSRFRKLNEDRSLAWYEILFDMVAGIVVAWVVRFLILHLFKVDLADVFQLETASKNKIVLYALSSLIGIIVGYFKDRLKK
jgi:surface polysaccharide O-acyltransferase-like enzyme